MFPFDDVIMNQTKISTKPVDISPVKPYLQSFYILSYVYIEIIFFLEIEKFWIKIETEIESFYCKMVVT